MIGRRSLVAAGLGALTLGLAGCPRTEEVNPPVKTTLRLATFLPCTSFQAAEARWGHEAWYLQAVYDTLLRSDPDGRIAPGLATKWAWGPDRTTLTLALRDGVTFSDGTAFDAAAARQNLIRFRDQNGPDRALLRNLRSVATPDARTLELGLAQPDPGLLTALSRNPGLQQSPASYGAGGAPVGTGPYLLEETAGAGSYTFTTNPRHWDPVGRRYDSLTIEVHTDPAALLAAATSGRIDAAALAESASSAGYRAAKWNLTPTDGGWLGLLLLDRDGRMQPALGDVRVRRAINHAFDVEALLAASGRGLGSVTRQVFPPSSAAYDSALDSLYPYDPARARSLLSQAGYASGLTLRMPATAVLSQTMWTTVAQQLRAVGITAELAQTTDYVAEVLAPRYAAAVMNLRQDGDWLLVNDQVAPGAPFNPFGCADDTVTAAIDRMAGGDDTQQAEAARALNRYLVEQAWFAPWYRPATVVASDPRTAVTPQAGNVVPYLRGFRPA